jgi:streptopain
MAKRKRQTTMKKYVFLFFAVASCIALSCSKQVFLDEGESDTHMRSEDITQQGSEYTIPLELAIEDMYSVLNANPEMTKSSSDVSVRSSKTISFGTMTKSGDIDNNPKLYVIGLSDGCTAVLGADYRAPGVMAILDEGTLDEEDFQESLNTIDTKGQDDYRGPTEGDKITYVDEESFPSFLAGYFQEYVESRIVSSQSETKVLTTTYGGKTWETYNYVPRLLKTVWSQGSPFNDDVIGDHPNCPAGCVSIALGQILAFFQYPSIIKGVYRAWPSIRNVYTHYSGVFNDGTISEKAQAASLVYAIGQDVDTSYDPSGSGAYDSDVIDALESYGFQWVQHHTWANVGNDMDYYVRNSLLDNRPVFYTGQHMYNWFSYTGHAWVVDGYWDMHCNDEYMEWYRVNFGWEGLFNGWYLVGVFSPSSGLTHYDPNNGDSYDPSNDAYAYSFTHWNTAITMVHP